MWCPIATGLRRQQWRSTTIVYDIQKMIRKVQKKQYSFIVASGTWSASSSRRFASGSNAIAQRFFSCSHIPWIPNHHCRLSRDQFNHIPIVWRPWSKQAHRHISMSAPAFSSKDVNRMTPRELMQLIGCPNGKNIDEVHIDNLRISMIHLYDLYGKICTV